MLFQGSGCVCALLAFGSVARAADPAAVVAPAPEPIPGPPKRYTHSGFGFGLAHLGAATPASAQRFGVQLELRQEAVISADFQFNVTLFAGVTRPENTLALLEWGVEAGRTLTGAVGDVTEWTRGRPGGSGLRGLRTVGAIFAYTGLGMAYLVIPVVWVLSPFASIGHAGVGPTLSLHTGPAAPDGYIELGFGGLLYGDPIDSGPGAAFGPMIGGGAHLGDHAVGARLLVSPPGLHTTGGPTLFSGALVFSI